MKKIKEYLGGANNGVWINPGDKFLELNKYLKTLNLYVYNSKVQDKESIILLYKINNLNYGNVGRHNYTFEDYNKHYKHLLIEWNHIDWENIRTEVLGEDYNIDDILSDLDKLADKI